MDSSITWHDLGRMSLDVATPQPRRRAPPMLSQSTIRPAANSSEEGEAGMLRIFFATDVHGSDICWKKFIAGAKFYSAQVLVLGGDMTGKAIVPLVRDARGHYRVELMDQVTTLRSEDEAAAMEKTISGKGYYPVRLDQDELTAFQQHPERVDALFTRCVLERIRAWMEYADARLAGTGVQCYVCPGNDDVFAMDDVLRASRSVCLAEGRGVHPHHHP